VVTLLCFRSAITGPAAALSGVTVTITSVTPVGVSANFGNPPPQYPPVIPPPSSVSNTTNINVGGGVVIPVGIAITPVLIKANAEFSPQFNVELGPFKVTFDAGGVTLSPSFTFGSDKTIAPSPTQNPIQPPPTPKNPLPPASGCDLTPVLNRLSTIDTKLTTIDTTTKDTKTCSCPGKTTESTIAIGNGNSGNAALPAYTKFVSFEVGTLEANVQGQWGGGVAPNVRYVGWASFSDSAGSGGDRTQLQYQGTSLSVPAWATRVSWTIKGAMVASVKATRVVPDDSTFEPAVVQFKKKPS